MRWKIWRPFVATDKNVVKRLLFCTYSKAMRIVSRTGIARVLLPLKVRKGLGQLVGSTVRRMVTLDAGRPYDVLGSQMYLHPGSANLREVAFGLYEPDTVELFQRLVKPGMTVVDVGAHIGFYSLLAARHVGPNGRVYAFEPNPEVYEIFIRNIEANEYQSIVSAIPKAVSNREGKVRLYIPAEESAQSSLYAHETGVQSSIEVETLTLDKFFAGEGWPKVDLVKIDVEGAEVEVLEGMKEVVSRNAELKLIVEFNPGCQLKSVGNVEKIFETLITLGFRNFYALCHGVQPVRIPEDIQKLMRLTETTQYKYINLLCER